ncbi:putative kinase [Microbacterium murale]|uniref:Kinase n=2 Tax=Microbacterium murale TaxID=1081040 RepID=A0ABU0P9U5_9MICO|nr:putative kinase [Microbacterium murale]
MSKAGYCIFMNGLPGSGKSTYARKFVASRRGWLNLDVDVLRGLLGTASTDFLQAGAEVQPLALAMLREHISSGGNVIFPQLFFTSEEASEFEAAVIAGGGQVRRTMLHEDVMECWRRVEERGGRADSSLIDRNILNLLTEAGGLDELRRIEKQLAGWSDLPDPPQIINSSTPYSEIALLAH